MSEKEIILSSLSPLYIKRNLILSDAFLLWCKNVGFKTRLPKDDLHVTVAYSKEPVNISNIILNNDLIIDNNSERELKQFGDAVVFAFKNEKLYKRWQELRDLGCSWDYDDYTPHITITYNKPIDLDISKIDIFKGQLILGKEILEELNLEKKDEYQEINIENKILSDWE